MTTIAATLRCDRCGHEERFDDLESVPCSWGVVVVQVQAPNQQPRQCQGNLCPSCVLAPSIFTPTPAARLAQVTNGALAVPNRAARRHP